MKKTNTITMRLGLIITGILLFCIVIIFLSMYRTNYDEIKKAAGVEAYGCANITTALIDPQDIEKIKNGDTEAAEKLGEDISWTIQHKNIFEGQYVMDLDKKLIAVDENLMEQGYAPGDEFYISDENLDRLLVSKSPTFSDVYEFGGMKRLTGYAPVFEDHDPEKDIVAISAIDFESSILHSRTWDMIKGSLIFSVIPILLVGVATIYLIKRTTDPLKPIIIYANRLADGDLTVDPLEVKRNDEIGELSRDLNTLGNNLKGIISQLSNDSAHLAGYSEQLSASGEEVAASADQNMQSIHNMELATKEQAGIIQDTNHILHDIANKTSEISGKAAELSETSTDTNTKAGDGDALIRKSIGQMEAIRSQTDEASNTMDVLNKKSEEINDIITIITKISEQTNLLALNAAIEASHAGESGKGFAVVADEIRTLAEQSSQATSQIGELIREIQNDTEQAVQESDKSIQSVKEGTDVIQRAGESFQTIQAAIHKESEAFGAISEEIGSIAKDIERVVTSMNEIQHISEESTNHSQEVFAMSEEQVSSMKDVTTLMNNLTNMADELNKRTHDFKI